MFNKNRIIDLINEKGWTAYRLCKEAGMAQSTLSDILNGKKKNPSANTLNKIATALGVAVDEFFKENSIKNDNDEKAQSTPSNPPLTIKEQEKLDKEAQEIVDNLAMSLSKNKEYLKEQDYAVLEASIRSALETIKLKNKEKYTPKKYKNKQEE